MSFKHFKKTYEVTVTYKYTIETDPNSEILQEYENPTELITQLANYRFSPVLPVVNNGVTVTNIDTEEVSYVFKKMTPVHKDKPTPENPT